MKRLVLSALILASASTAQAQSMNVREITRTVVRDICAPFLTSRDMWAAIRTAETAGYAVASLSPAGLRPGTAEAQPSEVELVQRHAGTVRLRDRLGLATCSVGIAEGSVATIAETAEPFLRDLGLEPVSDDREGPLAISVWRGEGRQAVVARSTEFRPGSEIVLSADVRPQD